MIPIPPVVSTLLKVATKVAEIGAQHPEATAEVEKLIEALAKSSNPTEAARRAALAVAAHATIDAL